LLISGRFDEAEKYHFGALKGRKKIQGKTHPLVGACLNDIGIMYYQKGDWHKALKYYEAGLDIKRKNQTPVRSLVNSLSNTANMYSETGDSTKAIQLLNEALAILNKEKLSPRASFALIYDTLGKVNRQDENLTAAEDMFQKALDIREEISIEHVTYLESLVHLASIHKLQKRYKSCIQVSNKALRIKETIEKAMPQNPFAKECLECLAEVYKLLGSDDKYIETLEKLESELIRLERVYMEHGNGRDLLKVRKKMQIIKERLESISF
jgi:tetratricopeptide (TPR) repeat protein